MDAGAHFHRCDFQVHTPRDLEWAGTHHVTDDDRKAYGARFIQQCRDKGLDAVAITDHHDHEFFRYINEAARTPQEFNYHRGYIGLQSNGVVKNFVWFGPRPMHKIVHIGFLHPNAAQWKDRFDEAGVRIQSHRKRRVRVTVSTEEFKEHEAILREAIVDTVKEFDS